MLDLDANIQHILMFIGALTCLVFAFLFACTFAFLGFLLLDGYQAGRKAKYGRHLSAGEVIDIPDGDDVAYFDQLLKYNEADILATNSLYGKTFEKKHGNDDETRVQVPLRIVASGWEQENLPNNDDTMVYPFNMEGKDVSRKPRH